MGLFRDAVSASRAHLPEILAVLVGTVTTLLLWPATAGKLPLPVFGTGMDTSAAHRPAAIHGGSAVDVPHPPPRAATDAIDASAGATGAW